MIRVGSDVGVACDDTEIRGVVLCEEDEEVVGDGKEGGRAQRRWCVELEGSEEEIVVNEEQLRVLENMETKPRGSVCILYCPSRPQAALPEWHC